MVYEYDRPSVSAPPCSYSNLCSYNNSFAMGVMPPMPSRSVAETVKLVPAWGSFGYQNTRNPNRPQDAFKLGPQGTCTGYYSVKNAYPQMGGCSQYTSTLCNR